MGQNRRGVRDGTGPRAGSRQDRTNGGVGRRQQAGEPCPKATVVRGNSNRRIK